MNTRPAIRDQKSDVSPQHSAFSPEPSALNPVSPRQIELKRLISEAKEMQGRWGGLRALLERIERNDHLEDIGGEQEAIARAHNAAATRWTETREIVNRLWAVILELSAENSKSSVLKAEVGGAGEEKSEVRGQRSRRPRDEERFSNPRGQASSWQRRLLRPCVCGHDRYKHVCFERECREAGCRCQWFGEKSGRKSVASSQKSETTKGTSQS